jgi:hypothetical protein
MVNERNAGSLWQSHGDHDNGGCASERRRARAQPRSGSGAAATAPRGGHPQNPQKR